jgi:archaellum component FlaC
MSKKSEESLQDFKEQLLLALEDEKVRERLREILTFSSPVESPAGLRAQTADSDPEHNRLQANNERLSNRHNALEDQLNDVRSRLADSKAEVELLQKQNKQLLDRCLAQTNELQDVNSRVEKRDQEIGQLQKQITVLQQQLAGWRQRLQEFSRQHPDELGSTGLLPVKLTHLLVELRQDKELQDRFRLDATRSDLDLLLQTVAALSDETSLRRLWDLYKKRCEDRRQGATPEEQSFYLAALDWYNSRFEKPFTAEIPDIGSVYQHERHMLPPLGMQGEIIRAVWLPGVPGLRIKALVATELVAAKV